MRDNVCDGARAWVRASVWALLCWPVLLQAQALSPAATGSDSDFADRFARIENPALGLGLMGVHDWSPEQPFLDVMKTARPWIGHLPDQWGGAEEADLQELGVLGPGGWPFAIPPGFASVGTVLLTDLPEGATDTAGRYLVLWQGDGDITLSGLASEIRREKGPAIAAYGADHALSFTFAPGQGLVDLRMTRINPANPLRNLRVVRQDRAALLVAGGLFNPDFLDRLAGVRLLRFMDWAATNGSELTEASERPQMGDYSWARKNGVPLEVMIALANELEAEPWLTLPHQGSDALNHEMAAIVLRDLDPGLRLWVEYSNEVWNWQFAQASWADDKGRALWGEEGTWLSYYALRAAELMGIWAGYLPPERLVRVLSTQTGWPGLEEQILAPQRVLDLGRPPPVDSFDAWAVTGYFQGMIGQPESLEMLRGWIAAGESAAFDDAQKLGLSETAARAWAERHGRDYAFDKAADELRDGRWSGRFEGSLTHLTESLLPYHAAIAAKHGLALVMYEGGSHVTGIGPVNEDEEMTRFFTALNYTPQMAALYTELLAGWRAVSDQPFTHYGSVYTPGRYGSWGGLRHLSDDNPRWRALIECAPC